MAEAQDANKKLEKTFERYAKTDLPKARKYLLSVINGEVQEDQYDPKKGKVIKKNVAHSTRVAAVKVYADTFLSKVMPDKKDVQQTEKPFDHEKALQDVAARKKAEKQKRVAAAGGKVVPFKGEDEEN